MPFLPSWPPWPCSSLWTSREALPQDRPTDRPPRAPSPPKSSPVLRLPAQRTPSSPSRLPVRVERPSRVMRPQPPEPGLRPRLPLYVRLLAGHLRLGGAFKGPFKEWNSQFLGPPWQMTTHLVCGIAQTDSLTVVEVRSPKWILPDKPRGVPRAGSFWSFRRRSCCLGSPARGGARLPWPVALTSLTPRPSPRPLP